MARKTTKKKTAKRKTRAPKATKKALGKKGYYACKVPKGGARRGCGGGAKVVPIEKALKRINDTFAKAVKKAAKLKAAAVKKVQKKVQVKARREDPFAQRQGETPAEYLARIAS